MQWLKSARQNNFLWFCIPFLAFHSALTFAQQLRFGSCYARWTPTELTMGNDHIERTWRIAGGVLEPTSFYDRNSRMEWLVHPGASPRKVTPVSTRPLRISTRSGTLSPVEAPSVEVDLTSGSTLKYRLQIFAEARGVEIDVQPARQPSSIAPHARALRSSSIAEHNANLSAGTTQQLRPIFPDELSLIPQHLRLTEVDFLTDTDHHNQVVSTREWMFMNNEDDLVLHGDLFFVEDVVSGSGLVFLKQATLPQDRPAGTEPDMRVTARDRTFDLLGGDYPSVVLAYSGGRAGRIATLQSYQRQLRQYDQARDGLLLSNTWGDRNRDSRNTAAFVHQEIAAGARLGVDIVEIDDGWQAGLSSNSARGAGVFTSFWSASHSFWDVNTQRYPLGLDPLVAETADHGMKLGLWYAPDSSNEFANWERDADRVLSLYRDDGITYFKFDSIDMSSTKAEMHVRKLLDKILNDSHGAIAIDLDLTGKGRRPGYFGAISSGPVFVENRYTDFHRYWPHLTLRNLWQLSEYVDPLRLRMEFLDNMRNSSLYPNDPLAPDKYTPDALFATVMFSNPLGWFETSTLPQPFDAAAAPLIARWKQERATLYSGTIIPIGAEPDGVSWTGFASVRNSSTCSYMLVFRELSDSPGWATTIPLLSHPGSHVTVLAGKGTARTSGGTLTVEIPEKLQYLWLKIEP